MTRLLRIRKSRGRSTDRNRLRIQKTQSMTTSVLEALPVEIKASILHAIPDPPTLLNLIIASREYRKTYDTYRETVLPAAILNEVANKGIFSEQPIAWMELCVSRQIHYKWGLEAAILIYYTKNRQGQEVRMTYGQCMPLMALEDARTWGSGASGSYVIHGGGPIFRSRRVISSRGWHDTRDHEFSFFGLDTTVPYHLMNDDGTAKVW